MDCSLVSAALVSICMSLPGLGDAPPFKHRAEPQLTEWGLREVYLDSKAYKALWYEEIRIMQRPAAFAYGKMNKLNSLFPDRNWYFFVDYPYGALYLTPSTISFVRRWEFY